MLNPIPCGARSPQKSSRRPARTGPGKRGRWFAAPIGAGPDDLDGDDSARRPEALRRQRFLNRLQSVVLLVGLFALAAVPGFLLAGTDGVVIATGFMILNPTSGEILFQYIYGAVPLTPASAPRLSSLVAELARRPGLDRNPTRFLIPTPLLQAMAAGSRAAPSMAVTSGLLQQLSSRELAVVLGHEIAHIRHGDMFVMRLAVAAGSMTHAIGRRLHLSSDRVLPGPVVDGIGAIAGGPSPS